jgi:hypothetical protein
LYLRKCNRLVKVEVCPTSETIDHEPCAALRFFRLQKPVGIEIKPSKQRRRIKAAKAAPSAEATFATTAEPSLIAAPKASAIKSAPPASKTAFKRATSTAETPFAETTPSAKAPSIKATPAPPAEVSALGAIAASKTAFVRPAAVKSAPSPSTFIIATAKLRLCDCGDRQNKPQRANQTSKER